MHSNWRSDWFTNRNLATDSPWIRHSQGPVVLASKPWISITTADFNNHLWLSQNRTVKHTRHIHTHSWDSTTSNHIPKKKTPPQIEYIIKVQTHCHANLAVLQVQRGRLSGGAVLDFGAWNRTWSLISRTTVYHHQIENWLAPRIGGWSVIYYRIQTSMEMSFFHIFFPSPVVGVTWDSPNPSFDLFGCLFWGMVILFVCVCFFPKWWENFLEFLLNWWNTYV